MYFFFQIFIRNNLIYDLTQHTAVRINAREKRLLNLNCIFFDVLLKSTCQTLQRKFPDSQSNTVLVLEQIYRNHVFGYK